MRILDRVLVRVTDPARLSEFVVFLHNSGFPLARKEGDGVAKLFSEDEPRVREVMALWEAHAGVRLEVIG